MHLEEVAVYLGDNVTAYETVLGKINTGESTHLHFIDGDIDKEMEYNPLFYISPFEDTTPPTIDYVKVVENETTNELGATIGIGTKVDVLAKAYDGITTYGGWNNGIYSISCEIQGPEYYEVFWGHLFDYRTSKNDWDVNKIYAPGSSSSTFIYVVTNFMNGDYYWDTSDLPMGQYTITVSTEDRSWNSTSVQLDITTPVEPPPVIPPSVPQNLTATADDGKVRLIWSASDQSEGYYVYRSTINNFTPSPANRIATTLYRFYNDTNVDNGTTYYYKISAYNERGESGYSNEVNATPNLIIWVDWRNTGTEDGSYEHPYNTIMEGINAATNGYAVRVRSGTYNESVQMKTGVNLIGSGNTNTIIEVSGYSSAVAFENVSDCKLSSFGLKGYVGVKCDNSDDVIIEDNFIYGSWTGIYLYESSPEIKHNTITGNDFGIYAWSHSDPEVYDAYNDISDNDYGVRCSGNSEPALGYYYDYTKGNNNISNITWDVYAYSSSQTVFAIYNYWQNGGTPKVHHENSSYSIEYEPMLEENPLGKASVDNPVAINLRGLQLFYEKRYREALREFKYVIDNYPHHPVAPFALDNLMMTYRKMKREDEVLSYLRGLAQLYPDDLLGGMASEFIIPFELEQGDFNGAITRINSLRDRFSEDELGKNVFFKLGMIYKYRIGNGEKAEKVFRQIIERYPKEEIARLAEMELHTMDLSLPKGGSPVESGWMSFLLSQNYPNPFNPMTRITFTLPRKTHVTLEIYNLLGQRVRTLVEGVREAGSHSIVWDGKDERGQVVSSGIYFYRLQAGDFLQAKKMLLVR